MRILVLGATGRTGRHVIDQAVARGHEVSGLVRSASYVKTAFASIVGDPTDSDMLASAIPRHDIVISCLGQRVQADGDILQRSAQAVRDAMRHTGGRPLFVVSQGLLFPSRNPLIFLLRWVLASHIRDSTAMESVLRATDINWMIVRPPRLLDGGKSQSRRSRSPPWRSGIDAALGSCRVPARRSGSSAPFAKGGRHHGRQIDEHKTSESIVQNPSFMQR